MDRAVSAAPSRFANRPDTLAARAVRAELRDLTRAVVDRQLRSFARAIGSHSTIHAVTLEADAAGMRDASVPSDARCWTIGMAWLLRLVADRYGREALMVLTLGAVEGWSWRSIGFRMRMDPLRAQALFFAAAAALVCDPMFYADQPDEAA
jgi:hypothetical protein